MAKYFNGTNDPIRIDYHGHVVGGAEWFESKSTPEIRQAIENGDVIELEPDAEASEEPKTTGKKNREN